MANRICTLRGVLKFNDPCSADVVGALRAFATNAEQCVSRWQFPHPDVEVGDSQLTLTMHVRGRVGYSSDSITSLVEALGPLTAEGGVLELHDAEYPQAEPQLYWVGATERDKRLAQVRYGLDLASEYLMPAIGSAAFSEIVAFALGEVAPDGATAAS